MAHGTCKATFTRFEAEQGDRIKVLCVYLLPTRADRMRCGGLARYLHSKRIFTKPWVWFFWEWKNAMRHELGSLPRDYVLAHNPAKLFTIEPIVEFSKPEFEEIWQWLMGQPG